MTFLVVADVFAGGCALLFGYRWLSAGGATSPDKAVRYRRGTIGMIFWVVLITAKLALQVSD